MTENINTNTTSDTSVTTDKIEQLSAAEIKPSKVTVKQCRKNSFLPEGHDGLYRYTGCAEYLTVQNKRGSNQLITGLTPELEREFEKKLNLPGISEKMPQGTLSKYNKTFWATFKIPIPKDGLVLNIENDHWHELYWYVLKSHQEVAKSEEEQLYNPYARYVLISEEQEIQTKNKRIEIKSMAYRKFNLMSTDDMRNFLLVYRDVNRVRMDVKSVHSDKINAAVGTIVEESPSKFINIVNDPTYKTRIFLEQCVESGLIDRIGTSFYLRGGDLIGHTMDGALVYLVDQKNHETVLNLKNRLVAIRNDNQPTT